MVRAFVMLSACARTTISRKSKPSSTSRRSSRHRSRTSRDAADTRLRSARSRAGPRPDAARVGVDLLRQPSCTATAVRRVAIIDRVDFVRWQQRPLAALVAGLTTASPAARRWRRPFASVRRRVTRWWLARIRRVLAQAASKLGILGPQNRYLGLQRRNLGGLCFDLGEQHLDLVPQAFDPLVGDAHPYVRSQPDLPVDPPRGGGIRTPPRERLPRRRHAR